jgi:hypothetical protein
MSYVKELNTIDDFIDATKDKDYRVRKNALKNMCPCKVKKDIKVLWDRIFEMYNDESGVVRKQVGKIINLL